MGKLKNNYCLIIFCIITFIILILSVPVHNLLIDNLSIENERQKSEQKYHMQILKQLNIHNNNLNKHKKEEVILIHLSQQDSLFYGQIRYNT